MTVDPYGAVPGPAPLSTTDAPAELAGWWTRAAAWLLDGLVVAAISLVVGFVVGLVALAFGQRELDDTTVTILTYAVAVPLGLAYAPLLLQRKGARNGQTLGKQAMRVRVVRDSGEPVVLRTGIVRELLGRQIPIIVTWGIYALFDYLWPLREPSNRCLHDKLANTRVVRLERGDAPQGSRAHAPAPAPTPPSPDAPPVRGWLPPQPGD